MEPNRQIPASIKREVRKRCGFGCVICGFPIYDYEHMEEWSKFKRLVAEEITLLCSLHHREKTVGLLPRYIVKEANKQPYNLRTGVTKPYSLFYDGISSKIRLGGITIECNDDGNGAQVIPLIMDDVPIICITLLDGHYLLD